MAETIAKESSKITFIISPEPRHAQVDLSQGNFVDIVIVAQNRSGRSVRVQAILDPIGSQAAIELDPLPVEVWASWLEILDTAPELDFEAGGQHRFRVRISLPPNARLGTYQFRLILSGVENPDEEFATGDPITFTITGPQTDIRPFAIGAAVILALVILGIIAAVFLIGRGFPLQVTLEPPETAVQGEPAKYILTITNTSPEPARNVMINYVLPESVVAATAFVYGGILPHCDSIDSFDRRIRCDLGDLAKDEDIQVTFLTIPGPGAETITNTLSFSVSVQGDKTIQSKWVKPDTSAENTEVSAPEGPYAIALLPSTSTPLFNEDFTYQVLAWSTLTTTQQITFTFTLPAGMRYTKPMPAQCSPRPSEYFTVECHAPLGFASPYAEIDPINLPARATSPTFTPARLEAVSDHPLGLTTTLTTTVDVVSTALFFDGIDDWVQLGYNQAPKSFTVEMWVHPYSSNDGQSFAGLHREESDGTVSNLFLVGYWFGSLHVNLNGESHNLKFPKHIDRYHLAVTVESSDKNHSKVIVYVNGVEQEWDESEPAEVCDRCKIFNTVIPSKQTPLPWVLGQDWDMGSQGKRRSDFFHGTLSEVRIWEETRSKDQIFSTYQVRPQGDEPNPAAYYRLEPVDRESDVLVNRVDPDPDLSGTRMGATWIEAEPLYGTALSFNGLSNALPVPGLQLTDFKPNEAGQVEVTLAAWVLVEAIPSQQEWILGSTVPSGGTLDLSPGSSPQASLPEVSATPNQAALVSAQIELLAAMQAARELNLDAGQAAADGYNARQWLFYSLNSLRQDENFSKKDEVVQVDATDLLTPSMLTYNISTLAPLAAVTSTLEIANYASAMQVHIARYQELKGEYDDLSQVISDTKSTAESGGPVQVDQPLSTEQADLVKLQMLVFLLADERVQYDANLQSLLEAAERTGFNIEQTADTMTSTLTAAQALAADQMLAADQTLESFPPYAVMRSLARLERAEQDLTTTNSTGEQAGAQRIVAFQSLQSAQETLSQAAAGLEIWLQTELQATLPASYAGNKESGKAYIANMAAAQYNLQRYMAAQINLEAVLANQERIAAAQEQVAADQAQAEAVAESGRQAQAEAAHRQQLEENVIQAELAAGAARTPQENLAAQRRLETARIELENDLLDQYRSLLSSMEALQVRETTLIDLEPRLNSAVDRATEAAFSAARRYNVERWIGPFLDRSLGTRTPLQSPQEAIRPAALLAAQQALKNTADAKVDTAQKEQKDALEVQNRLTNSNGRAARRQQIIDQINAYLDSLNKDVNTAQQNLNEALAEQQGDLGESQIPLVLAEALAQTVADQVTAETIRRLPSADTRRLLSSSAGLEALAKTAVRANVANALEISRQPVRIQLYYQSTYAIQRLDTELNAGGLGATERNLKSVLRGQLAAVNTALLHLLNAQNLLLRPASELGALVGQVADESQAAADIDTLVQELQDALQKATHSLDAFLALSQAQGRTSGLSLPANTGSSASDESTTPGTAAGTEAADTTSGTEAGTTGLTLPAVSTPMQTGQEQITTTLPVNLQPPNLRAGLLVDNDGHVMLAARPANGGDWAWEKDEKPLPIGQWVHYAAVIHYDVQTGAIITSTLYRDGSKVKGVKGDLTAKVPTLTFDTLRCPAGFYIGGLCDTNGRFYFAGRIDEVRVWNRALDQDEIDAWRKMPGTVFDEWAYWAFDDGPGRSSAEICLLNMTCDLSPDHRFHLHILGPGWIEADFGQAGRTNERP